MDNFDLKKYLVENKRTSNSRTLKEMITADFDWPEDLWFDLIGDEEQDENAGYELLGQYPNAIKLGSVPTNQEMGTENYEFYDIGEGLVLAIDDYTGYGNIYKKSEILKKLPELAVKPINEASFDLKKYLIENKLTANSRLKLNESIDAFSDVMQRVGIRSVEDALEVIERYENDFNDGPVSREQAEELIADLRDTDEDEYHTTITNLVAKAFELKFK